VPHLSFPVAETAVHGALAGDEKENPVRIVVGQTRDRRQLLFVQGIIKASFVGEFPHVRHSLFVEGVFLFPDEPKAVGVDPHGIFLRDSFQFFRLIDLDDLRQIARRCNTFGKNALPSFFMAFWDDSQEQLLVKKVTGEYMTSNTPLSISASRAKAVSRPLA
jgi:hypothetical protein